MTDSLQGFLDSGASFQGKMCFTGVVRVDGHLQGDVSSEGTLVVGETGVVEATLQVGSLIVHGVVLGDVKAEDCVEIAASGQLEGSIETARLVVAEGAQLSAKIAMTGEPARDPGQPAENPS